MTTRNGHWGGKELFAYLTEDGPIESLELRLRVRERRRVVEHSSEQRMIAVHRAAPLTAARVKRGWIW